MGKSDEKNSKHLSPICCDDTNVIESKQDPQKSAKPMDNNQRRRWIFNKREKHRDKRGATVMVDKGEQYDEHDILDSSWVNNNETDKTDLQQR